MDLVDIDPPFDSGADYVRRVQLRGASGTAPLDGETYTLGEQIQCTDNVTIADIPERKTDIVAGEYRVSLPEGWEAPVAVKITDMFGEEVLVILPR